MEIDETSIEIIKSLRDGRISFGKIAQELSLTENTVRTRVAKLIEEGVLDIAGAVDASAVPGHEVIVMGVDLESMDSVKKGEEISKVKGVVSVKAVTGRYHLLVTVLLSKGFNLERFLTDELARVDGIRSVEIFVVYKAYNFKVPYVL